MQALAAIVLAALVLCGSAARAEQTATIYLRGWGSSKCEVWSDERRKLPPIVTAAQANWVFGFLGAYNFYVHRSGGIDAKLEQKEILSWLDRYCEAHPGDLLAQAATALVKELGGKE